MHTHPVIVNWKEFEVSEQDEVPAHRRFEIVVPPVQLEIIKREIYETGKAAYSFPGIPLIEKNDRLVFILTQSGCWEKSPLAKAGPYEVTDVTKGYGESPSFTLVHYAPIKPEAEEI